MSKFVLGFSGGDRGMDLMMLKHHSRVDGFLLNGVGGPVTDQDDAFLAMLREFKMSSGIDTRREDWRRFACMSFSGGMQVECFKYVGEKLDHDVMSEADLARLDIDGGKPRVARRDCGELLWLIGSAISSAMGNGLRYIEVA